MDPDPHWAPGLPGMSTTTSPLSGPRAYEACGLSPCTTWRSVGASTAGFFTESFIDELIHAAGLDPMQARIEMCTVPHYRKLLETVAQMSDWKGLLGTAEGAASRSWNRSGHRRPKWSKWTKTERGIRIDKVWVAVDVGKVMDPVNFENQVQGAASSGGSATPSTANSPTQRARCSRQNHNHHEAMRIYQCPVIEVRGLENDPKVRGVGEPPGHSSRPLRSPTRFSRRPAAAALPRRACARSRRESAR